MTHQHTNSFKKFIQYFWIAISGKETEFTSGSIRKAIFMLSIPMILEMLMESIFALVDIAYVSQVSVNAVATIGLTESVITLVYALAIGLSMAATAVVARRIGEKDVDGARVAAVQAIGLGGSNLCGYRHFWNNLCQGNFGLNGWRTRFNRRRLRIYPIYDRWKYHCGSSVLD